MQHPPGPWTYEADTREEDGEEYVAGFNIYAADGTEVVGCEGILGDGESAARLMAAAPELLAVLQDCVLVMERELGGLQVIQPELAQARAAIAKATPEAA